LFATMTNVNFSTKSFIEYIHQAIAHRETLKTQLQQATNTPLEWSDLANFTPDFEEDLVQQGKDIEYEFISKSASNVDIFSLKLTVTYGIKGMASYAFHAQELGQEDDRVYTFCHEALAAIHRQDLSLNDWVNMALKVGEMNFRAMELLDAGNTGT
ncbi:MAG TPA: hydroxylamine reductase, partial [Cyanobacteria bacterium UBA11162]|nr:hydroxylamine reductase [Cyanobacteria bacterium UBA11162]